MLVKQHRIKAPPTLHIDEADPFAWIRFLAGLVWGNDPRRMNRALATYTSELMGILREVARQPAPPVTLEGLGRRLAIPPAELARMPGSAAFYTSFFAQPDTTYRLLDETVFDPIGHFRTVAEAPSSEQLLIDFTKAVQGGAFYAGIMLALVTMLKLRHPEIPASLNRAIAILESLKARGLMSLPSDRTLLTAWKNWRHMAPLWAALTGSVQAAQSDGLCGFSAGLETLQDPARLGRVLGHAKWFRSFATTFVPDHATAPLIPEAEALQIITGAPEMEPPLSGLARIDLEVAQSYQAPTRKFFPV
jgi:hypothetical protein